MTQASPVTTTYLLVCVQQEDFFRMEILYLKILGLCGFVRYWLMHDVSNTKVMCSHAQQQDASAAHIIENMQNWFALFI